MPTCYIDVHGVLLDLVSVIGYNIGSPREWPKGKYDLEEVYGFNPLNEPLPWSTMEKTLDADTIFRECSRVGYHIRLVTVIPSRYLGLGMATWRMIALDKEFSRCPLTILPYGPKGHYLLPQKDDILVDDSERECAAWPGKAILVPRLWNSGDETGSLKWLLDPLWEGVPHV